MYSRVRGCSRRGGGRRPRRPSVARVVASAHGAVVVMDQNGPVVAAFDPVLAGLTMAEAARLRCGGRVESN